jgi:4-diphosphocytidyl-2-C-methyl-D-erythritol kinase
LDFLPLLYNTFEECLADSYPGIARVREDLISAGCESALLSGSGSTVWGVCRDETSAQEARKRLEANYPFVAAVRPWDAGPRISTLSGPGIKSESMA